ncbi:MAG: polysaccharide biosynthesis C-terminal domain-containing protein [Vicinamibacterales bacterium]
MLQKVRDLAKNLAVYGAGDVAIQIVSFLLVPIYVRFLSPADYGVLGLLGGVEAAAKLFFRWGLDGAFMRFWYDCEDAPARQRLASTIFFFLLAVNALLLIASVSAAPFLSLRLLGAPGYTLALQLVLLNTFAIAFTFIPFHVMRIEQRTRAFSGLTFSRSLATLVLRILLVVGLGYGIWGVVVADVLVTAGVMLWMVRWFAPLIRPVFATGRLRESLAFGLPRLPHAIAQQVMAVGDRFILSGFGTLADIGVYSMSVSFGLIPKLFLSAFENAWAPFYYATSREPDGARTFGAVTTYVFAVLVLLTTGLAAIGRDLLALVVGSAYAAGGPVIAWTAVGVLLQGVYLLTSIGLNITKHTRYYPVSTIAGAGCNVGLNLFLIPRYGIVGAAWANAAAYGVQAVVAYVFSQRFYPITYERGRITRVAVAGAVAYVIAILLPDMRPLLGVLTRGTTVVMVMGGLLGLTGFLHSDEWRGLLAMRRRRPAAVAPPETVEKAGEIVTTDLPDDLEMPDIPGSQDRPESRRS